MGGDRTGGRDGITGKTTLSKGRERDVGDVHVVRNFSFRPNLLRPYAIQRLASVRRVSPV